MHRHGKIDYIELPAGDLDAVKAFFSVAFGWEFVDYGSDYTSFSGQGVDGGFFKSDLVSSSENGAALIVFYSDFLERTRDTIISTGGTIVKSIFSFPGGRRFHFTDPNGNEYGVWSDVEGK